MALLFRLDHIFIFLNVGTNWKSKPSYYLLYIQSTAACTFSKLEHPPPSTSRFNAGKPPHETNYARLIGPFEEIAEIWTELFRTARRSRKDGRRENEGESSTFSGFSGKAYSLIVRFACFLSSGKFGHRRRYCSYLAAENGVIVLRAGYYYLLLWIGQMYYVCRFQSISSPHICNKTHFS